MSTSRTRRSEESVTKYLSDAPDAQAHRKGSIVLSKLKAGNKRAEAEIKHVLEALIKTRHIGFHLQFLEGLADYYINEKRDSDAESIVSDALKLLETNPESY